MNGQTTDTGQQWIRVWFGEHVLADYTAEPEIAAEYAAAMSRRFMGLRVTSDPLPDSEPHAQPLPGERMWELTAV